MLVPTPGTPDFDRFVAKANRDPNSVEAMVLRQMNEKAANQAQDHLRGMLNTMIEVVPGQLFRDIGRFHAKFELSPTSALDHSLPRDLISFRIKFMLEELQEYAEACGFKIFAVHDEAEPRIAVGDFIQAMADTEKAFDGLIDLAYVTLGTAFLHRFPFNEGWSRVQAANMAKERATSADDERSVRKHSADIVKPVGWKPPVLTDLLSPFARMAKAKLEGHTCCAVVDTSEQAVALEQASGFKIYAVGQLVGAGASFDRAFIMSKPAHEHTSTVERDAKESWISVVLKCRLRPGGELVYCNGEQPA